jgi:hypothetical protein
MLLSDYRTLTRDLILLVQTVMQEMRNCVRDVRLL